MPRVIVKKSYTDMFEKVLSGEKTFDMRVADFECKPGDILKQVEVSHDGTETGRVVYHEIATPLRTKDIGWWDNADIERYGYLVMSLHHPQQKYRQIVDERDVLLTNKWQEDIDYARDIYRVAALQLINSAGQILLAKRSSKKENGGGCWGPAVAGTLEYDETYRENIARETNEEIGLSGIDFIDGPKNFVKENGRRYFCQYFYAISDKSADEFILEDAVEAVQWLDLDSVKRDASAHPEKYIDSFVNELESLATEALQVFGLETTIAGNDHIVVNNLKTESDRK